MRRYDALVTDGQLRADPPHFFDRSIASSPGEILTDCGKKRNREEEDVITSLSSVEEDESSGPKERKKGPTLRRFLFSHELNLIGIPFPHVRWAPGDRRNAVLGRARGRRSDAARDGREHHRLRRNYCPCFDVYGADFGILGL